MNHIKISFATPPMLRLYGYSPDSPEAIFDQVQSGCQPSSLRGDFIVVAEGTDAQSGKPLTVFITSVISAVPYYYVMTDTTCVHGPMIIDCVRRAGLTWQWNWSAVGQIALFDHVLGDASLHPQVQRVPAASIVIIRGTQREFMTEPFWQNLYHQSGGHTSISDAADMLVALLGELPSYKPLSLSLSAGYDSRVLLAGLAYLKRTAQTACMGAPDATDPRIAERLARVIGYGYHRVALSTDQYVSEAERILAMTSGEKVFCHWHTGIYAHTVGFDPQGVHLAGSNGEFARSYFFDKGFVARMMDVLPIGHGDWWLARGHAAPRTVGEVVRHIDPQSPFAQALDIRAQLASVYPPYLNFGDGMDVFYAMQRVRNFIGLGMALYRADFPTMSPFLDARFIQVMARLRRQDKLANAMHRGIIEKLQPTLLTFPTDETDVPMGARPSGMYFRRPRPIKGYSRSTEAQRLPQVRQWAHRGFRLLGGSESSAEVSAVVERWNLGITVGAFSELLQRSGVNDVAD